MFTSLSGFFFFFFFSKLPTTKKGKKIVESIVFETNKTWTVFISVIISSRRWFTASAIHLGGQLTPHAVISSRWIFKFRLQNDLYPVINLNIEIYFSHCVPSLFTLGRQMSSSFLKILFYASVFILLIIGCFYHSKPMIYVKCGWSSVTIYTIAFIYFVKKNFWNFLGNFLKKLFSGSLDRQVK